MEENFDFIRYCDDNAIDYRTRNGNLSQGWLMALDCPFCGVGTHKYHMGIPEGGTYGNCWSCGGHSLKSILYALTPDIPTRELLTKYSDYVDMHDRLSVVHAEVLPFNFVALGKVAKKYLTKREFDADLLEKKYGLRDGGMIGNFNYRIIIPIIYNKVVVAYQGRSYTKLISPKYKFLAEEKCIINPKHILYNLDNCKHRYTIITEGVFDCIRLAGKACTNVCATMGISVSGEQIRLIADRFDSVHICFDPEPVAQIRAHVLAERLSVLGVSARVINTETPYDLGDTPQEEASDLKRFILQEEF